MLKFVVLMSLFGFGSGCALTGINSAHSLALVTVYEDSGGIGHPTKQQKRGESCSYNVMGIVAAGDSSIRAAKSRGGVNIVSHYDKNVFNLFWVFGKVCTIVYGS